MNKLYLFTLLFIIWECVVKISCIGMNHANERSPASIIYADGPAPDELKAGPTNKNNSDHRKQNTKAILQRYIVTTGAPTIETVYQSSAMKPNLKSSSNDEFLAEKLNSNDFNAHYNGHISGGKQNHPNDKVRFTNSHFERITDDESSKFQAYDSTTTSSGHQVGISLSDDSSSTHIDSTIPSVNHPTSSVYPVYSDPILRPGVHSTSFTNEQSTYSNKGDFNNDDSSEEIHSSNESDSSNSHSLYDGKKNTDSGSYDHNSERFQHTTPNPSISPGFSISTNLIESKIPPTPSVNFKQTHHIMNHQPISNNQTEPNVMFERFTYGDHINNHQNVHIASPSAVPVFNHHPTVFPVYHPQPRIHHIPVVTEIPITEEQEHHGVIEKTFNVPQHGIQTKTYEIRRPAIQKQFYDIEEHVSVKPAGSVVIEIDKPISKVPTGHISTIPVNVKTDGSSGTYLPPVSPHPISHGGKEHGVPHENDNGIGYLPPAPPKPVLPHDDGGQGHFNHGHNDHSSYIPPHTVSHGGKEHGVPHEHGNGIGYLPPAPPKPVLRHDDGGQGHFNDGHNDHGNYVPPHTIVHNGREHEKHFDQSQNGGFGIYVPSIPLQPIAHNGGEHDKHLDHGHNSGHGSYVTPAPLQPVSHGGAAHGGSYDYTHNTHYLQPHGRIVYIGGGVANSPFVSNDCNNQPFLYNLHQINNVPHYSIPIGSAVTTTQTSGHLEDDSVAVNVKHSEKYVDSLKKHTPNYTSSSKTLETLGRLQDAKSNLPQHQSHSPQMVAKGEPDFSLPPYVEVKSRGQPFSVNRNGDKNFATNTLYTMQSIINNNLYNGENKETSEHSTPFRTSAQDQQDFTNKQNGEVVQQPVHVALVQEINKNQFQSAPQGPRNSAELESIESLIISPKIQQYVEGPRFQIKAGSDTVTEPSVSTSTTLSPNTYSERSNVQNSQYLPQPSHIEVFNSETYKEEHKYHHTNNPISQRVFNSQAPGVTYQQTGIDHKYHSQKLQTPIRSLEDIINSRNTINPTLQKTLSSNQNGVTYQGQTDHTNNHPQLSQNLQKQDYEDKVHLTQNGDYSQVPAITYHIRTDQFANIRTQNQQSTPQSGHIQKLNSHGTTGEENLQRTTNYQIQNSNYPHVSISGSSAKYSNEKTEPAIMNPVSNPSAQFLTSDVNLPTSTAPSNDAFEIYLSKSNPINAHVGRVQSSPSHSPTLKTKTFEKGDNNYQSPTSQNEAFFQVPAASYQLRTDQLPFHSTLIQAQPTTNFENSHNDHSTTGYQNAQSITNFQTQPCQSENPLIQTATQQFSTIHATETNSDGADIKYPQLNSKYQQIHPPQLFQNPGKESSTSFASKAEQNQQEQISSIPEYKQNLVTGYITPQNYQLPPQINNQLYKNDHKQYFMESNTPTSSYLNQNKPGNVAPQLSSIQYFPPNNKIRTEGLNSANQQRPNTGKFDPYEENRDSYNFTIVQKTHHGDNSGSQPIKSEQYQSPSLQIAVDNYNDSKPNNSTEERRGKKPKSERYRTHSAIQDSVTTPNHSHLRIANNIHPGDSSISFHPLPSQSQSHILEYLLTNKGHSAQPVISPEGSSSNHNYGLDSVKTRVVSATPASKFAKAAGEKVNTRRIVINQPIETVQIVEEQVPITTYKQVTVQQPTVYKTQTIGVKKVETTVPVMISPIYSGLPVYHGNHDNSHVYLNHNDHLAPPSHDSYHIINTQVGLHSPSESEYSHAPVTVH